MPIDLDTFAQRVAAIIRKGEGSAYDTGPAYTMVAVLDEDGAATGAYRVELQGESLGDFDDVYAALAHVEGTDWFIEAVARKNPEDLAGEEGLASGRWFDAAHQEDVPAVQGGQLTQERIDEVVRNLAGLARAPVIDGGLPVSIPHKSIPHPANTPATGYVLAGVRAIDADGVWHLWLYGMLKPVVEASVNDRDFVYGSVAFLEDTVHPYTGEDIGARLLSYALTSEPYQDGLRPHAARSEELDALIARAGIAPTPDDVAAVHVRTTTLWRTKTMPKSTNIPASAKQRGPASDLLVSIAAILGVDLSSMDDKALYELQDKIYVLKTAAAAEVIVENAPAPGAGAPAAAAPAEGGDPAPRMLEGLEGDAFDAWGADVLAALRGIFEQPEATPEQALDLLNGSAEAFAAVIAEDSGDGDGDNAGEGGQPQGDADTAGERTGLRATLIGLQQTIETQASELTTLRAAARERAIEAHIDERFAAAKLTPPAGERRAELVGLCRSVADFKPIVDLTLRAANVPPQGLSGTHPTTGNPVSTGGEPASTEEAIARCKSDLLKSGEKLSTKKVRARSYAAAKANWPQLFRRERDASTAD